MQLQLEDLPYQQRAIDAAVSIFNGQCVRLADRPLLTEIHANACDLSDAQIAANKHAILEKNGLKEADAHLSDERCACIEMETGTGKTLVYLRTIYELYRLHGHTKFIILTPSIAIKEGIINTLEIFAQALKDRYGHSMGWFEYDSRKLRDIHHYIGDNQPQILLTTIQAFTAEDRILNQQGRDDGFSGKSYLEALGEAHPVIVMDEPQEGMDTDLAQARLTTLQPLFVLRYSATHKRLVNRLYRLTPADAYTQGMVKKIEVLSVAEKNDEATLKIELTGVQAEVGKPPKAKLKLWHHTAQGFKFKDSKWLKPGDNLALVTGNVSYQDYSVERISKTLRGGQWVVVAGGVEFRQNERQGDVAGLFRVQIEWLIRTHFDKQDKLRPLGIKCLSLVFIDRVDNYLGADALIKRLFAEEYARVYRERTGKDADKVGIEALQGYYFAQSGKGEFTDSETTMRSNKAIYDLILRDKQTLLSLDNPVEFIFSHSALGVGWDNPNVFNIATLNQSYSETKKRQEIGRGLRICVNQNGQRVYDPEGADATHEINLLTVIPNETYETFARQYQAQIEEEFGDSTQGANLRKNHKGGNQPNTIRRQDKHFQSAAFRNFWDKLARRANYRVSFDEATLIRRGTEALNALTVETYRAAISLTRVANIDGMQGQYIGEEFARLRGDFSALDLVEELSEKTSLSYQTVLRIVGNLTNLAMLARNPPQFIQKAIVALKRIELDEMLRELTYEVTGDTWPIEAFQAEIQTHSPLEPTPVRGIYDHAICDSGSTPEHNFARAADTDTEVVCFIKLPDFYKIPTPAGNYTPDFGVVMQKRSLKGDRAMQELWLVIETKGTNDINDTKALTEDERTRILCAQKHFAALGVPVEFIAPVKDYAEGFKSRVSLDRS
jgi:type III restriction enzyme